MRPRLRVHKESSLTRHFPAGLKHPAGLPRLETGAHGKICLKARCQGPEVVQPEVSGSGKGAQSECQYRLHPPGHGLIDDGVHMAFPEQVIRVTVIAYQHAPGPGVPVHQRKKRCQVLRLAALPDHDVHPLGEFLTSLGKRRAFMV